MYVRACTLYVGCCDIIYTWAQETAEHSILPAVQVRRYGPTAYRHVLCPDRDRNTYALQL
jgi:hypothetical protein